MPSAAGAVEAGRQGRAHQVGPGGEGADPERRLVFLDAAQGAERRDVENVLARARADPGRIVVSAARDDLEGAVLECLDGVG